MISITTAMTYADVIFCPTVQCAECHQIIRNGEGTVHWTITKKVFDQPTGTPLLTTIVCKRCSPLFIQKQPPKETSVSMELDEFLLRLLDNTGVNITLVKARIGLMDTLR